MKKFLLLFLLVFFVPSAYAEIDTLNAFWHYDTNAVDATPGNNRTWTTNNAAYTAASVGINGTADGAGTSFDLSQSWTTSGWSEFTVGMMILVDAHTTSWQAWSRRATGFEVSQIRVHDNGNFIGQQGSSSAISDVSLPFSDGKWYCLVFSAKEGDELKLWVNGSTATAAAPSSFGTPDTTMNALRHDGQLDEMFIATRAYNFTDMALYCDHMNNGTTYPFLTPPSGIITVTVELDDLVTGTNINSASFANVSGDLTFDFFNVTDSGFCVTMTGNGTSLNCTTGSGESTFFNVSVSQTIVDDTTVTAEAFQAFLNVTAHQLYTLNSITTLNGTNNQVSNQTTSSSFLLPAQNGANNVQVDVPGNFTLNVTCTVSSPLTTSSCNATGVYDNELTVGASFNGAGVNGFNLTITNTTLGIGNTTPTTNGYVTYGLLFNHEYYLFLNTTLYSVANTTFEPNASTNTYNFTLQTLNTFDMTFFNETTNTPLVNATVFIEVISDAFAEEYNTTNGSLKVTLLQPGDYTLRYWNNPDIPREYYLELVTQSYNNLSLYVIDEQVSNLYAPLVKDQALFPVSGATLQLLRAYIVSGNTYEYKVVEMAKTDTTGKAVFRVQPNIINYKFLITKNDVSLSTQPEKFTTSTSTYILSFDQNPLSSQVAIPNVFTNLTFVNSTLTYVWTWSDASNIVSSACLVVTVKNQTGTGEVSNACSTGSSGSLIYTITDVNETSYEAVGILHTNTEFSTYSEGPVSVSFLSSFGVFGLVGFIIMMLTLGTVGLMSVEDGPDSLIITSVLSVLALGAIGVVSLVWEAAVGILIVGVFLMYKMRG